MTVMLWLVILCLCLALCDGQSQWSETDSRKEPTSFFDFSPQGVAHIGEEFFIFSGKNLLKKTTQSSNLSSIETIEVNHNPLGELPPELSLRHIGDGDVNGNILYLPIEGENYVNPSIALYDTDLHWTGSIIPALNNVHCPWVVWWRDVLLSSEYDNVFNLTVYNATSFEPLPDVRLGFSNGGTILFPNGLQKVQGGTIVAEDLGFGSGDVLLLSSADTNQPLITVNLYFDGGGNLGAGVENVQYLSTGGEQEGITSPPDGSLYSGCC
uniref:Uncharacterized protein n=1 Tax=Paramoeba aestuarina TaxID=180227 RepID=A0A7S4L868_9EUKA